MEIIADDVSVTITARDKGAPAELVRKDAEPGYAFGHNPNIYKGPMAGTAAATSAAPKASVDQIAAKRDRLLAAIADPAERDRMATKAAQDVLSHLFANRPSQRRGLLAPVVDLQAARKAGAKVDAALEKIEDPAERAAASMRHAQNVLEVVFGGR